MQHNDRTLIRTPTALRDGLMAALIRSAEARRITQVSELDGVAAIVAGTSQRTGIKTAPAWRVSRRQQGRGR